MMAGLRKWFSRDGERRQEIQVAESRQRVVETADRQSELLREACELNVKLSETLSKQKDVLEQFLQEIHRGA